MVALGGGVPGAEAREWVKCNWAKGEAGHRLRGWGGHIRAPGIQPLANLQQYHAECASRLPNWEVGGGHLATRSQHPGALVPSMSRLHLHIIGQNPVAVRQRHLAPLMWVAGNLQRAVHHNCTKTRGPGGTVWRIISISCRSQSSSWKGQLLHLGTRRQGQGSPLSFPQTHFSSENQLMGYLFRVNLAWPGTVNYLWTPHHISTWL